VSATLATELCNGGPRAMVKKIVEGIVPGDPAVARMKLAAAAAAAAARTGNVPPPPGGGSGGAGVGGMPAGMQYPGPPQMNRPPSSGLPQRPGAAACIEFVKTGGCSFGMECPYNHP
jgi:hypothetical protein